MKDKEFKRTRIFLDGSSSSLVLILYNVDTNTK